MIAENGVDAERRLEAGEHARPLAGGDEARHLAVSGHVVAEHDNDIGVERVGPLDDPLDPLQRHPGIAGVQIRDHGDVELETGGPLRRRKVVAGDAKLKGGLSEPVRHGRDAERAQPTQNPEEMTA